jgi:outer membrane protein OmpA-like peptidoglycan-associated protein
MKTLDDVAGNSFLFKVFRASDQTSIDGDIDAIDNEKTKKIGTYKANVHVKLPNSKLNQVSFVCEVFGYRKVQRNIDYANPEGEDITRDEAGAVVVPFELMRLQKGDIAVMYNVYFFKDAAIMRPESRYEVNSLLEMLNENVKYKIKLHGHTNGNAAGKIISMSKKSENFFSLHDTHDGIGSAKQLSEDRAAVIRRYMISNGIDPARIEVKAWGGKRAIHDKHSSRAQENVRVEVEILEDK